MVHHGRSNWSRRLLAFVCWETERRAGVPVSPAEAHPDDPVLARPHHLPVATQGDQPVVLGIFQIQAVAITEYRKYSFPVVALFPERGLRF